ncbi:hypothetical protein OFC58_37645, partial [Escherichia coli]|nr:hypothetical protein [Escherichia coli]
MKKRKGLVTEQEKKEELEKAEDFDVEEKAAALSFGDENADLIQDAEINSLLNMYKNVQSTEATRTFYEQNMQNDAALG